MYQNLRFLADYVPFWEKTLQNITELSVDESYIDAS
jgi:hypothetical protein